MLPADVRQLPDPITAEIVAGGIFYIPASEVSLHPHQEVKVLGIYEDGSAYHIEVKVTGRRKSDAKTVKLRTDRVQAKDESDMKLLADQLALVGREYKDRRSAERSAVQGN